MHTGVSSQESLSQVLRNISQRRRQGVLELHFGDRVVHVHFVQGKIVELAERGSAPAQEIANILVAANLLSPQFAAGINSYQDLLLPLQVGAASAGTTPKELVKRAVRHRILSKLYLLDLDSPALHSFDSTMVEYQRDFAPSISVGQLLLDIVALHSDRSKFLSIFGSNMLLSRGEAEPTSLSEEEMLLHSLLAQAQDLDSLRLRSMLSEYAFQDALLRMHEQKHLTLHQAESSGEEFLDEKLLNHLDAAIDEVFEDEGFSIPAQEQSAPQSQVASEAAPELSILRDGATDTDRSAFISRGIKRRLALASARALHMHWVPAFVMALFLLSTLLVPLFLWHRVFEAFAG